MTFRIIKRAMLADERVLELCDMGEDPPDGHERFRWYEAGGEDSIPDAGGNTLEETMERLYRFWAYGLVKLEEANEVVE